MEISADKISTLGKSFIINLHILIRTTAIYDSLNEAIANIAQRLQADLEHLLYETGEVSLKIIEGSFYIEGVRIKAGVSEIESFLSLAEELMKKTIGVLDFRAPVSVENLVHLAYALKKGSNVLDIHSALENMLVKNIAVGGPVTLQREEAIDLKDSYAVARRAYVKMVAAIREIDTSLKTGRRLKLKKIKRALQLVVDCIQTDTGHLLEFATSANNDHHHYFHPVNVTVLSLLMGKKIGCGKLHLRTLAMTALFHDIGKVEIPVSILSKKEDFTAKEQELIQRHPVEGVKIFLKSFGLTETTILSMLVSYEHHMKYDFSGYPDTPVKRRQNLFSRIVSIADDFDSLVSGQVYERKKRNIADAINLMLESAGTRYDPLLMKAFAGLFSPQ